MALKETVVLAAGIVEIHLGKNHYRLRYGNLVEYAGGLRRVRGRRLPYAFRSVEQLRYDFERDVEGVGGRLG